MAFTPMTRSGWCLKLPVTEYNTEEHDGCAKNFSSSTCTCTCGHKGERSLESRNMTFQPYVPPKKQQLKLDEND